MATVRVARPQAPETLDHLVLVVIDAVQALGPRNGIPARPRRDSAPPPVGGGSRARGTGRRRRGRGRGGRGDASKGCQRGERARHRVVRAARNGRGTANAVAAMRTESHPLCDAHAAVHLLALRRSTCLAKAADRIGAIGGDEIFSEICAADNKKRAMCSRTPLSYYTKSRLKSQWMTWKSRRRGDGSSGGGASIFGQRRLGPLPLKTIQSIRRVASGRSTAHIGARGGARARRRCARERRRSSARTRCASTTRSPPRPPPAEGSDETVANPSATSSASCPRARRWRSRWRRCPRSRSSSASPRCSRCTSASPSSRGSTATMVRPARRRRRSPRRATCGPEAFTRHPRRFPPLRRAKGRASAAPRRLPARSSRPSPRVRIAPLSHSADRLTPSPLSSPRAAAPPPPRRVENTGVSSSPGATSPSVLIRPAMGFALDPTVRMSLDDSFHSGARRRHPRPVPRPKRGSAPSLEANAMWERNLAEGSASDANSSADGSARGGGGDSAFGWSPRSSPLASPSQSRGGSTHADAEIPRAGILKRRATSPDVVSRAADEWYAATPSPSPSPSPPQSSDESSPRSSSSSSADEHEHERERERARVSDRRVRFGSETSVAEVLIDAPSNANANATSDACASRTSPRRASTDGTASLVMGTYREGKRSGMDANANCWRVGSTLHARVPMDGARAEGRPRRQLRFSAA